MLGQRFASNTYANAPTLAANPVWNYAGGVAEHPRRGQGCAAAAAAAPLAAATATEPADSGRSKASLKRARQRADKAADPGGAFADWKVPAFPRVCQVCTGRCRCYV